MAVLDGISGLTGCGSLSRQLLSSYGGAFYTLAGGNNIDRVHDQLGSPASYWLAQGSVDFPQLSTAGPNSRAAAQIDDGDQDGRLQATSSGGSALPISNFVIASTGYSIVSLIASSYPTDSPNAFNNTAVWCDASNFLGMHLRATGPTAQAYNWDGNEDQATVTAAATGTVMTLEWRHESGNLYNRIDGGSWSSPTASGDTTTLTGNTRVGDFNFNGYIFEWAFFNSIPSTTDQDNIAQNFYDWLTAAESAWSPIAILNTVIKRKWRAIGY